MRSIAVFVVLTSVWAAAQQATVVQGYASTLAPAGLVTRPFVPLVNTPEVSLDQPSLSIGASNATEGLVAGATAATGYSSQEQGQPQLRGENVGDMDAGNTSMSQFDSGGLNPPEVGIASLLTSRPASSQPARTFTNEDVEKLNQQTGAVKYGGKTEELH